MFDFQGSKILITYCSLLVGFLVVWLPSLFPSGCWDVWSTGEASCCSLGGKKCPGWQVLWRNFSVEEVVWREIWGAKWGTLCGLLLCSRRDVEVMWFWDRTSAFFVNKYVAPLAVKMSSFSCWCLLQLCPSSCCCPGLVLLKKAVKLWYHQENKSWAMWVSYIEDIASSLVYSAFWGVKYSIDV